MRKVRKMSEEKKPIKIHKSKTKGKYVRIYLKDIFLLAACAKILKDEWEKYQ